ncbi:MAG: hypothetical protein SPE18_00290 [Candidatus Limivicinus sp.]|nr:hypothetical protein [Candidatus Limivicinus sp.]
MNLLTEGLALHLVEPTTLSRKLTIDGITKAYPVYKVKLDQLFYNDQNDRIATWISQYKSQHGGQAPSSADREAYNALIEQFIIESNPDAIKKTQNNIEMVDQREPGVILCDGRIIDGNRRFTCLRRLQQKNPRFGYFETVILDHSIEHSAKQIKMLELSIQHGEEARVDYNPVDRLVGVYNDIIDTGLLTVEEYAKSTNETPAQVKSRMETAQLMVDFLEFINAPKQFYIVRDLQVAATLEELPTLLRKCRTEDEKEDMKIAVFTNILMKNSGEMRAFVRSIKAIVGSEYQEEFLSEQQELAMQVVDSLPPVGKVSSESIREEIRTNTEITEALDRSLEKATTKVKKNETRNRPIQLAEKATNFLDDIDANILLKMNDSELRRFERQLDRLEAVIAELRENL